MPTANEKQPDHQRIVARLAKQCQVPVAEMATLYEHERAELASRAHITKFVHIFASRNVREALQRRGLDNQTAKPGPAVLLPV